ncbi:MAG: flagellar basal body rod protein FlgB, partial [bacterium]
FESELQRALEAQAGNHLRGTLTDKKHIPIGPKPFGDIQPKIQIDDSLTWRKDGNNVDIDVEMAENTKNVIRYNAMIQKVIGEFTKVKKVLE